MNKRPVSYLQTDPRWANQPYRVEGKETSTVKGSGCGPTSAAMLIETLTGKTFTPLDACNWSMQHGYKAVNQGTYYSYFTPQFKAFGLDCQQLNFSNLYGNPSSNTHAVAFDLLKQGYYLIACMGKGLWTTSGHYIVVWWEDGKVRINDPASTKEARLNGDLNTFKSQVKYYWAIDARAYNGETIPVMEMNGSGIVTASSLNVRSGPGTAYGQIGSLSKETPVAITGVYNEWYRITYNGGAAWVSMKYIQTEDDEMKNTEENYAVFKQFMERYDYEQSNEAAPDWARAELGEAVALGITDGTRPMQSIPRYQAAIMAKRAAGK